MRGIFLFLSFLIVEAEYRNAKPYQKLNHLVYQSQPQSNLGESSVQSNSEESPTSNGLVHPSQDYLSISSTWRHNGRSFYLIPHAVQSNGNGEIEDMGEEMDENIPYNRGLPGMAFSDLNREFDDHMGYLTIARVWRKFMMNLSALFIEGVIYFFIIVLAGVVYKSYKEDPTSPPDDGEQHTPELLNTGDWRFGLCNCCAKPSVCCMTVCCPVVRWADTMEMSGLMVFWLALAVCAMLVSMSYATFGLTYFLFVLMATHGRQQMRELFGIPGRTAAGCMYDFCVYSCCCYCAIAQEAQQLEEAWAVGHPVVRLPPVDLEVAADPGKGVLMPPSPGATPMSSLAR